MDAGRLRSVLELHPERFRVLEPWSGSWRGGPVGRAARSDRAWVVGIADPGAAPDAPAASLRLRESVRWLSRGVDPRSIARALVVNTRKQDGVELEDEEFHDIDDATMGAARIRRHFGVYPLAVHRRGGNLQGNLDSIVLAVGDTLMLEGAPEDIQRLSQERELVNITEPSERPG